MRIPEKDEDLRLILHTTRKSVNFWEHRRGNQRRRRWIDMSVYRITSKSPHATRLAMSFNRQSHLNVHEQLCTSLSLTKVHQCSAKFIIFSGTDIVQVTSPINAAYAELRRVTGLVGPYVSRQYST